MLPAIGWFIMVTVLLTLPGSAIPKEDWLDRIWFDKWVHIGLFAGMTFLWCWGYYRLNTGHKKLLAIFILVAILALLYGIAMEYVQLYFISNRSFDVGDILADGIGCLAGWICSYWMYIKK